MAKTFQKTHGDIAEVLETLSVTGVRSLSRSQVQRSDALRDLHHASAYDGKPIINTHPVVNWLNALGEPLLVARLRRLPADGGGWASSGQISRRFEIARAIGSGNGDCLSRRCSPPTSAGFPQLSGRLYFTAVDHSCRRTPAPHWTGRAHSSSGTPFYLPRPISTIAEVTYATS